MKTSNLQGAALDWAVAKAVGERTTPRHVGPDVFAYCITGYSTEWEHGGPLIEQHGVSIADGYGGGPHERWIATTRDIVLSIECGGADEQLGPTPLIAACRAIVAAKLGDEVDVPKELTT